MKFINSEKTHHHILSFSILIISSAIVFSYFNFINPELGNSLKVSSFKGEVKGATTAATASQGELISLVFSILVAVALLGGLIIYWVLFKTHKKSH